MRDVTDYLELLACEAGSENQQQLQQMLQRLPADVRAAVASGRAENLRIALGLPVVSACMVSVPSDDEDSFDEQPLSPDEQPDETQTQAA